MEIPSFEERVLTGTASGIIPVPGDRESGILKSGKSSRLSKSGFVDNLGKEDSVQVVEDEYISDDFEDRKYSNEVDDVSLVKDSE